jgi:hypothetical protein
MVVLLFSVRLRGTPLESTSSPKKSVSCVSAVFVFVMSESVRLVFIGFAAVFIVVVPEI